MGRGTHTLPHPRGDDQGRNGWPGRQAVIETCRICGLHRPTAEGVERPRQKPGSEIFFCVTGPYFEAPLAILAAWPTMTIARSLAG